MQASEEASEGPNRILRFQAGDMEIRRQVGEMGYATVIDWEYYTPRNPLDPESPSRTYEASGPAVRLFEARIARGSLRNARVLLKEYFPKAREIAEQELRVYTDLVNAWDQEAPEEDFGTAPVATLRGWFQTTPECERRAFRENWMDRFPKIEPPSAGNLWLMFRWEGNKAMSEFGKNQESPTTFWDQLSEPMFGPRKSALKTQFYFMRNLIKECLATLTFLHERGIVHRSIGASSITLNSFDVTQGDRLQVKLRDFGFASRVALLDDSTLKKAQQAGARTPSEIQAFIASEDIYAMGYALAETIFTSFAAKQDKREAEQESKRKDSAIRRQWLAASSGAQQQEGEEAVSSLGPVGVPQVGARTALRTDQDALKKLMEDVFDGDVEGAFRSYCAEEEQWADVVAFLDLEERAGWRLLNEMINSKPAGQEQEESKALTEMSDDELADLVPSFAPTDVQSAGLSSGAVSSLSARQPSRRIAHPPMVCKAASHLGPRASAASSAPSCNDVAQGHKQHSRALLLAA
eukprot:CAMPEP_0181332828 /NCGR_PEP_ID=MMETSP1101-20121128/25326_1 /TAXON_ID=46948 /ORGANISM="Rhodomonas abbreviata, Strain Caron Lab Isolate" /LENGTH=521 /DNA_ID=CAMNT_0023442547 /DNA_START=221 /DNA_END=1786 /DNA_ORIENTATION=+